MLSPATARQGVPPPDYYALIKAAKYLGVPPWELAERPTYWQEWANDSQSLDNEVEKEQEKRAEKNRKRGKGSGSSNSVRMPLGV